MRIIVRVDNNTKSKLSALFFVYTNVKDNKINKSKDNTVIN